MKNKYVFIQKKNDLFGIYVWANGMKLHLQVRDGGYEDEIEAKEDAAKLARTLEIELV
ncbi:hypothetical protein [Paenibacillus odorifer]|uniref:hypothetical protein n=1 Tax=Paenibacillus odorifer TaxID=189426 RepID=UPI0015C30BE1|nr:hypothetical protein [Paenibacillus odorifer]